MLFLNSEGVAVSAPLIFRIFLRVMTKNGLFLGEGGLCQYF